MFDIRIIYGIFNKQDFLNKILLETTITDCEKEFISLSADMIDDLLRDKERTGTGPRKLLAGAVDIPDGLTEAVIWHWLTNPREAKRARRGHFKYVCKRWRELPNHAYPAYISKERVSVTPEARAELCRLQTETRIGTSVLLRGATDKPAGLTGAKVKQWMDGAVKTSPPGHLEYVLKRWRKIPKRIALTTELIEPLRALQSQTGIGAWALLRGACDMPDKLSPTVVSSWLGNRTKNARKDHYDYVLRRWKDLAKLGRHLIMLDNERLTVLRRQYERSGIHPNELFHHTKALPDGLTPVMITNWLRGNARRIRQDHYEYVLRHWRAVEERRRL